jgi:sialate O-acetylesterase
LKQTGKTGKGKKKMEIAQKLIITITLLIITSIAAADVTLPAVISDNMVLQQQTKAPIWGWADPGEKVIVRGSWKSKANTTADENGKWSVKLKTPKAGGPYKLIIKGKNTIKLENILIGEVWICSGQSNMKMAMTKTENPEKDIAAANFPNIRFFTVKRVFADQPKDDCEGNWSECSPETVKEFSAVGYFFGKHLYDEINVPIGLVSTNWAGTLAEAWTRREILETDEYLIPIIERHKKMVANLPQTLKKYEKDMEVWKEKAKTIKAEGKKAPGQPRKPVKRDQNSPSSLYNAMIAPLIPYSIKGVIWYQGESNTARAYQYTKLFPAMITNWRTDWKQGDFPFYYVQIAPYKYFENQPSQELRDSQRLTLSLKNTGMAVPSDIGNTQDIHPKNKLDVGKRLALWALAKDYGKKRIVYSGPLYKSMKTEDSKICISFDHIGSGLTAKGGALTHFTIAGPDKNFTEAKATIEGNTIVVSSKNVKNPKAVRFAWTNTAEPNLFNKEGLPASTFRTDNWPLKTQNKR